jgi:Ras-related protein Rab-18
MDKWFEEVENNTGSDVVLYLVGTKLDRAEVVGRAVSTEEGEELARQHGALFCEVSAKTGEEVRRPFVEVVDGIIRRGLDVGKGRTGGTVRVGAGEEEGGAYLSGCAC